MNKYLIVVFIFFATLVQANVLEDKVKNIIGQKDYNTHKNLIKLILKDEQKFYVNGKIRYYNLFKELQYNGLLNLRLDKPKEITIEFKILDKNIKSYKILNDTMQSLGYRYFFTKSMQYDEQNKLVWKIVFKAEYMLDPVVLLKELQQNNCKVLDVQKKQKDYWYYEIDFESSKISKATKIEKNEKVRFPKPLRAFFLKVEDGKQLQVISRTLNNWFPHIVFFDKDLKILGMIKKDRIYRGFKTKIPKGTKYLKITDLYNLVNIKRGLTIIVR